VAIVKFDRAAREGQRRRQDAIKALLRFADVAEFAEARAAAKNAFLGGVAWPDDLEAEPGFEQDVDLKFLFYWLFDHALPDGRSVAETWLARPRPVWQAGVAEQRTIERFSRARLRLYQVEEVRRDEGLRLRDLLDDATLEVTERALTRALEKWDLLGVRVAPDDDGTLRVEGAPYLFGVAEKDELLRKIRAEEARRRRAAPGAGSDGVRRAAALVLHRHWLERTLSPRLPTLVTPEGDPMEFGTVVYDVRDETALHARLSAHAALEAGEDGSYHWFEPSDDGMRRTLGDIEIQGTRLILNVSSRARAARGRKLLAEAAGKALRYRSARYEDVAEALKTHRGHDREEEAEEVHPKDAADFVLEFKDRHYRTWADVPLPALGRRTPRDAARDTALRPRLVDLLKQMENMEARGARRGQPAYDFSWLWAELGLSRP
jgi:hypothetical protein